MQSKPMRFHLCFISVLYVHETRLLIAVLAIAIGPLSGQFLQLEVRECLTQLRDLSWMLQSLTRCGNGLTGGTRRHSSGQRRQVHCSCIDTGNVVFGQRPQTGVGVGKSCGFCLASLVRVTGPTYNGRNQGSADPSERAKQERDAIDPRMTPRDLRVAPSYFRRSRHEINHSVFNID